MKAASFLLLALAGCGGPDVDQAGHLYPAACSPEAVAAVRVPLLAVPSDSPLLPRFNGLTTLGYTHSIGGVPVLMVVDQHLGGWKAKDAIRHEKCHVISGAWHQ